MHWLKHYDIYNHLLESSQNQNARNTFITNKTLLQICKKRLVIRIDLAIRIQKA